MVWLEGFNVVGGRHGGKLVRASLVNNIAHQLRFHGVISEVPRHTNFATHRLKFFFQDIYTNHLCREKLLTVRTLGVHSAP